MADELVAQSFGVRVDVFGELRQDREPDVFGAEA